MNRDEPVSASDLAEYISQLLQDHLVLSRVSMIYDSDELLIVLTNGKRYTLGLTRYSEYDHDVVGY